MPRGTFTAANQNSHDLYITESSDLSLVFGTGTVKLQRYMNDDWRDVPGGEWTASTEDIVYSGASGTKYRLTCTAHTADIRWELS